MAVAGIELSEPMVAELRKKPGGGDVAVSIGDMASTTAPGEFSLVYLVFNAITCLLTQDRQIECFRTARAADLQDSSTSAPGRLQGRRPPPA